MKVSTNQFSSESTTAEDLTDAELVQKVLNGNELGYSEVLKRYQDPIYRMLIRQTGDAAVASDLAQETFIRAYEKLKSFRGDSSLSTWITRIALNLANNYFSSREYRERKRNNGPNSLNHPPEVDSASVEERLELLRQFIGELKPKHRSVLLLCGLEKKSYQEAAAILKVPLGTVRSRLHEARLTLRNRFLTEASDL